MTGSAWVRWGEVAVLMGTICYLGWRVCGGVRGERRPMRNARELAEGDRLRVLEQEGRQGPDAQ